MEREAGCIEDEKVTELTKAVLFMLPLDWPSCCVMRALNNALYLWIHEEAARIAAAQKSTTVH